MAGPDNETTATSPTRSEDVVACWCGNEDLVRFSPEYLRCARCETLVYQERVPLTLAQVGPDEQGLYAFQYWFQHQECDLALPNLLERARADLSERCLWWLRTLLKYVTPPGRVLELGCAHGGFVALLRRAGFEAIGLEISPAIVRLAREMFDVPVAVGPLEHQSFARASFDVIALMDVLEHLRDPADTMRRCLDLLRPDGILLVQTPRYVEGQPYDELRDRNDPFLPLLMPREHLHLFSRSALTELFRRFSAQVRFEPAIFAHYDMFAVVSRGDLPERSPEQVDRALAATPDGRLVQALLDLYDRQADVSARLSAALDDLRARDQQLAQALTWLEEARTDQDRQLAQVLTWLEEARSDRDAAIGRARELEPLEDEVRRVRADRARLAEDLANTRDGLTEAQARLSATEQALTAREWALASTRRRSDDLQNVLQTVEERVRAMRGVLTSLRTSRWYRLGVRLGRLRNLDQTVVSLSREEPRALDPRECRAAVEEIIVPESPNLQAEGGTLRRIIVDFTPVLPGGENGGAKVFAIELVRTMAALASDCDFVLLTSPAGHVDLAPLESPNTTRIQVDGGTLNLGNGMTSAFSLAAASQAASVRLLRLAGGRGAGNDMLLFCPFQAPTYYEPEIPTVSVVNDIQYRFYPQFFEAAERQARDRAFRNCCRLSDRVVCASEFTKGTVTAQGELDPEQPLVLRWRPLVRSRVPSSVAQAVLGRLDLRSRGFFCYPANFWPHKNHEILLTAFGMYRARRGPEALRLVLTGTPGTRASLLRECVSRMDLADHVVFTGYLDDEAFTSVLQSCHAVVFPSLFEGFGMPPLEAMSLGIPVACSNVTSLPEVVGDAALLFDPKRPDDIALALERLHDEATLCETLAARGEARVRALGDWPGLAQSYLQLFREVVAARRRFVEGVFGVYEDGWTGGRVTLVLPASDVARRLEVRVVAPPWGPIPHISMSVAHRGQSLAEIHIPRGEWRTIPFILPQTRTSVELLVQPLTQPRVAGIGLDERWVGLQWVRCDIFAGDEPFSFGPQVHPADIAQ